MSWQVHRHQFPREKRVIEKNVSAKFRRRLFVVFSPTDWPCQSCWSSVLKVCLVNFFVFGAVSPAPSVEEWKGLCWLIFRLNVQATPFLNTEPIDELGKVVWDWWSCAWFVPSVQVSMATLSVATTWHCRHHHADEPVEIRNNPNTYLGQEAAKGGRNGDRKTKNLNESETKCPQKVVRSKNMKTSANPPKYATPGAHCLHGHCK